MSDERAHSWIRRAVCVALAVIGVGGRSLPAHAALLGNNFEISGPGCRFPDVAFGTVDSKYLVVWPDYNVGRIFGRFVTATGTVSGAVFPISEAPFGALYPAIAYNSTGNEFLVTWDDAGSRGGVIFGQRVRGSDGALMGTNFAIGTLYGGIRSAVAWSPVNNVYLVTYWGNSGGVIDVFGQRVSGNGALLGGNFNISNDAIFSGYPAVAWGASGNQFLVTWDNEDGNIRGRRVNPATGALLGSAILATSGGSKDRSCVAYDSVNHRWLVQFNNGANAGFSYDQYGQFVNPDGTLSGGLIPLAHTTGFEGDTQFGGDVAFVPGARRFFSSFGTDTGMGAQESSTNGALVGPQVVIGSGYFTSLNNAADPQRNRFLTAWEGLVGGSFRVFGQLAAATINPVINFTAASQDSQNVLTWRVPNDGHFSGTMIRVKTSGYPTGPDDGVLAVDNGATPGANDSFTHTNLANWTTYYYAAFAHDAGPNFSLAAQAAATPRPAVGTVSSSDFNAGADGWTLEAWRAGTSSFGTIARNATAGDIVSTGSGVSNNRDACTREGSMMTRVISTAGFQSIQVEYDLTAALHVPPSGDTVGGCAVLDGSEEDKLLVSYSTSGTNGPWAIAQVLNEGLELPTGWTRKLINLAGVSAANNNPNFALRFQWQFNSGSDMGRIDNVRVLSGAVTALTPALQVFPTMLERTIPAGQNHRGDVFRVSNSGEGTLNFNVTANAPWLRLFPTSGSSAGPEQRELAIYNAAALAIGDHDAVIQVVSTNAANSPQTIAVRLHVIPPACFWEPFDFYNGNLTLMGSANWSGNATNQLQVEDSVLRIVGGGGQVSATRSVSCVGSNGLIAAQIKIRKGSGTGDFFWNIALDDSGGNNLARWYGGSAYARGRVGNNITADMPLTGPDTWDDLFVKLDTTANTSEFFFNGASFGAIPHGTTPSNAVGSIRLERLDRSSAVNDDIHFDNLTIGAIDTTPLRLAATRIGDTVALSWPAAGLGAMLQSTPALASNQWTSMISSIVVTNGRNTFTATATNRAIFYRLRRP
jgi:hypothetical protein